MTTPPNNPRLTEAEWRAEGERLFGADQLAWRFKCPVCSHVAATRDWQSAGVPSSAVAFSCVGRWLPGSSDAFSGGSGPCTYAGGGLFRLNPMVVTDIDGNEHSLFEFDAASNPRLIAELQAFQIALAIVGGDLARVPEVMSPHLSAPKRQHEEG